MQENRSITPGLGAFRLTLQSRENGFCGYVYSAALGCRAEFTSLARLIVLLEEWMNTATDSFPFQCSHEKSGKSPPLRRPPPMWSWRSGCASITPGRGSSVT